MDAKQIEAKHINDLREQGYYVVKSELRPINSAYKMIATIERDVADGEHEAETETTTTAATADEAGNPPQGGSGHAPHTDEDE